MDRLREYDQIGVFQYLDKESLKQCAEVSKQWAATIATNSQLMRQLPLVIKSNWKRRRFELMSLRRKHNSIQLQQLRGNLEPLIEALRHFLPQIKSVDIRVTEFSLQSFTNFLEQFMAVEKLFIYFSEFLNYPLDGPAPPAQLPALKSLHLETTDWGCLKVLKNTPIDDLTIVFEFPDDSFEEDGQEEHVAFLQALKIDVKVFRDFFESLTNLTTLKLEEFPILLINCLSTFQSNYGLKRLTLDFLEEDDINAEGFEKIIDFLDQHKSTLEFLEIWRVNEALMTYIWKNLKLSELTVHIMNDKMAAAKDWAFEPKNHHLKKLYIGRVRHRNTNFFIKMLQVYPSIQHLIVKRLCSKKQNLAFDAICSLKAIHHLEIPVLIAAPMNSKSRVIPSLEVLEVGELAKLNQRENFFIDFGVTPTVSISSILMRDVLRLVLPVTEHLKVGAYNFFMTSDYHTVSRHCPNLRALEFLEVGQILRQRLYHGGKFKVIQKANFISNRTICRQACCSPDPDDRADIRTQIFYEFLQQN